MSGHDHLSRWGYRPGLDALRALAVYLVVLFHSGLQGWSSGWVGVDLFFVLSGYVVLSVVITEIDGTGRFNIQRFYARRVRRLLPAAIFLIVSVCLIWVVIGSVLDRAEFVDDMRASVLYFANWHFISESTDYFGESVSPFAHFWSLAIEEQFYILMPLLVAGITMRYLRSWRQVLLWSSLAVCVLSVVLQIRFSSSDVTRAYMGTDTRIYQILAGACLALLSPRWIPALRRLLVSGLLVGAGLIGLIALASDRIQLSVSNRGFAATLAAICLVVGIEGAKESYFVSVIAKSPVVYLGTISYGIYLWHWPIMVASKQLLDISPFLLAVIGIVGGSAMAALSAQLLELPIRRSISLDRLRGKVVAIGIVVSVVLVVVMSPVLESKNAPMIRPNGIALAGGTRVPEGIDWIFESSREGSLDFCGGDNDDSCAMVNQGEGRVLLVGDSHARMLSGMFAELSAEHGFGYWYQSRPGCRFWGVSVARETQSQCYNISGENLVDYAIKNSIDTVVAVTNSTIGAETVSAGSEAEILNLTESDVSKISSTVQSLASSGIRTILIEPTPRTVNFDPLRCLASAFFVEECDFRDVRADDALVATYSSLRESNPDRVVTLNLDTLICRHLPICEAMRNGEVVFRDDHHISPRYWTRIRGSVWRLLSATGFFSS